MNLFELRDVVFKRDHGNPYLSSRGAQEMAVSIVFTALASCFVGLRMFTRIALIRRVEASDWVVIIALVNSYVFMGLDIVEATSGMGMHVKDIPPMILERQLKAFWLTIPFYNAAVLCAKASILLQYFRVFPTRRMRVICWIMITILAIYGTWAVISAFLNCVPVAKFWDPTIKGFCLSKPGLWFSNASMHITTDIVILLIPIPALIAIDIPKRQKIALMFMFALVTDSISVCITSIIRLVALKKISDSSDPTYDNVGAASWSAIECNTGIICACLPTLKPLLSRVMPGLISTFSGTRPTHNSRCRSNRRSGHWDESTLGAPGEDPEFVGADVPERVEMVPGSNFGKSMRPNNQITKTTSVTEMSEYQEYQHQHSGSESSSAPRSPRH
ncbi:Conidiation-specific protein Con-10 [Penicillium atrosanguineum]|uniref:Conidiation-specific protein Con-10 n=1 Tax=Penicillium atrosanguineum TaxID=1132637 RepID=UPI00239F9800|nr:Conidiation-specific protein Con-10 [Penicillium atrosanguineum]KAJ5134425.1 hypothetical protein N7526_005790 [Penicillium atrosanguineum]KAJ5304292.1 Conidiation-specific protein Con-10 [Penicillium atrosanguineum]